jgi:steroid 5-alpha reductase family enzyme
MSAKKTLASAGVVAVCLALAAGVAWAGSRGGEAWMGFPILFWCAAIAFVVQWIAFVPAYARQTERFYDLTGSLTYISVTVFALFASRSTDVRSVVLTLLVFVWASRLGTFLFRRIRSEGTDSRFDDIKPSAPRFFVAWTLQGLWVFLTLCAALAAITTKEPAGIGAVDALGLGIWALGFGIEAVADRQKSEFRTDHPGRFIDTGLWAWSRHPNYFGEIILWLGVATIAASTLRGWQWVTMISPAFVALLLTRISGIPILEKRADDRWGGDPDYERYKERTPVLIPRPPRR